MIHQEKNVQNLCSQHSRKGSATLTANSFVEVC